MTSRSSTAAPILAVLAIVAALLGAYVVAYLMLGERWELLARDTPGVAAVERRFNQQWLCTMFAPAAWCEARIIGIPVVTRYASPDHPADPGLGMPPGAPEQFSP